MTIDREFFYSRIRPLFGGHLSQSQVDGMNAVLADWDVRHPNGDLRWLAYMLATTFHETAKQMIPVKEAYWLDEEWRKTHLDYYPYYGRGYVQLTWRENYKKAGDFLGVDMVRNPDLALNFHNAAVVMFIGMKEGWFRSDPQGRPYSLVRFFSDHADDPIGARKIINGFEPGIAEAIAGYYQRFLNAIRLDVGPVSGILEAAIPPLAPSRRPYDDRPGTRALESFDSAAPLNGAGVDYELLRMTVGIVTGVVEKQTTDPDKLPEMISAIYTALANANRLVDRARTIEPPVAAPKPARKERARAE